MFSYTKSLQYPVKIRSTNPALAKFIISQYGGPDGELGASLRYLSQRFSMPYPELRGLLTDIGTEGSEWRKGDRFRKGFQLHLDPAVLTDRHAFKKRSVKALAVRIYVYYLRDLFSQILAAGL